jgi:hypothetical protein
MKTGGRQGRGLNEINGIGEGRGIFFAQRTAEGLKRGKTGREEGPDEGGGIFDGINGINGINGILGREG